MVLELPLVFDEGKEVGAISGEVEETECGGDVVLIGL